MNFSVFEVKVQKIKTTLDKDHSGDCFSFVSVAALIKELGKGRVTPQSRAETGLLHACQYSAHILPSDPMQSSDHRMVLPLTFNMGLPSSIILMKKGVPQADLI